MNTTLENSLYNEFHDLTVKNGTSTFPFGFDCGDGWFSILHSFLTEVSKHLKSNQEIKKKFVIVQIKEKLGELRIYTYGEDEHITNLISKATEDSIHTCEVCGNPGELVSRKGWFNTLCEDHAFPKSST